MTRIITHVTQTVYVVPPPLPAPDNPWPHLPLLVIGGMIALAGLYLPAIVYLVAVRGASPILAGCMALVALGQVAVAAIIIRIEFWQK